MPSVRRQPFACSILLCSVGFVLIGCSSSGTPADAALGNDAAIDAGGLDAGRDAAQGQDAAGSSDAAGLDAAGLDAAGLDAASQDASPAPADATPADASGGADASDGGAGDAAAGGQQFGQVCDGARTCSGSLMCFMFNGMARGFCTQQCDPVSMPCPSSPAGVACDLANATATASLCGWPCTGPGDMSCPSGLTCQMVGPSTFFCT